MSLKSLGLAYRARKVVVGTELVVDHIKKKNLYLVFVAADASALTKKKMHDKAKTYQVDVIDIYDSEQLSLAIGKIGIKVIGITDKGFAQLLSK